MGRMGEWLAHNLILPLSPAPYLRFCERKRPRALENRVEHRFGEAFGESVLLARMVGAEQNEFIGDLDFGAVTEFGPRFELGKSNGAKRVESGVESDFAKANHDAEPRQKLQFAVQIGAAVEQFGGERFVVGRRAVRGGGDVAVDQFQTIVFEKRGGLAAKSGFEHRAKQPIATSITGEHSPGAVGAVRGGRQTNDEKTRVLLSKRRHSPAPITLVLKAERRILGRRFAPRDEAGTQRAVGLNLLQFGDGH